MSDTKKGARVTRCVSIYVTVGGDPRKLLEWLEQGVKAGAIISATVEPHVVVGKADE